MNNDKDFRVGQLILEETHSLVNNTIYEEKVGYEVKRRI